MGGTGFDNSGCDGSRSCWSPDTPPARHNPTNQELRGSQERGVTMDNLGVKIEERLRAAFAEVMQRAGVLIDESLDDHFADMKMIFLRDRALTVSLGLGVTMNEAGQIEVELTTNYVKERVKQKTSARVTPGQMDLPGTGGSPVDPGRPEDGGEPFNLGSGGDPFAADPTDRHQAEV